MDSPSLPFSGSPRPLVGWLETLLISGGTAGLCYWLRAADPLFVEASFPWPLLAPLLVALRYGFAHGLVAGLLISAPAVLPAWWLPQPVLYAPVPYAPILGILAAALIAGEFRDVWNRRLWRSRWLAEQSQQRLGEFTRSYHLLRLSHNRMEQRLASGAHSLRGAIRAWQSRLGELAEDGVDDLLTEAAPELLELFREYGKLTAASLHSVDDGRRFQSRPLAEVGKTVPVGAGDRLVELALDSGDVVTVATRDGLDAETTNETCLVAAIPVLASDGRALALVAVRSMPFFALTRPNLQLLAVFGSHVGDVMEAVRPAVSRELDARSFARRLRRAMVDVRRHGLESGLATLTFPSGERADEIVPILRQHRCGLDSLWMTRSGDGRPVLVALLPFTATAGLASYLARVEHQVQEACGTDLADLGVRVRALELGRSTDPAMIDRFLARGGVDGLESGAV